MIGNTHVSSPVVWDVRPEIRYFLRIVPRCVTSTFTPRKAFLIWFVQKVKRFLPTFATIIKVVQTLSHIHLNITTYCHIWLAKYKELPYEYTMKAWKKNRSYYYNKDDEEKLTFTRSASDNGLDETSRFSSWVTKSITGSGSMNAVEDMSGS